MRTQLLRSAFGLLLIGLSFIGAQAVTPQQSIVVLSGQCAFTETDRYVKAMVVPPPAFLIKAINQYFCALKARGIWDIIDVRYMFWVHNEQAARLNIKNPGTFTLTNVNSVAFTPFRGFQGNGTTSYLTSTYNPSTGSVGWALNDAHLMAVPLAGTSTGLAAVRQVSSETFLRARVGNSFTIRLNDVTSITALGSIAAGQTAIALRRSSTAVRQYIAGVVDNGDVPSTSTVVGNSVFTYLGHGTAFTDVQYGASGVGRAHPTDAMVAADNAALVTMGRAVGAIQ